MAMPFLSNIKTKLVKENQCTINTGFMLKVKRLTYIMDVL